MDDRINMSQLAEAINEPRTEVHRRPTLVVRDPPAGPARRPEASDYGPPSVRAAAEPERQPAPPPADPLPLSPEAAELRNKMDLDHVHKLVEEVGKPYRARLDLAMADWEAFERWKKTTVENAEKAARHAVEQLAADRVLAAESAALAERAGRPIRPAEQKPAEAPE